MRFLKRLFLGLALLSSGVVRADTLSQWDGYDESSDVQDPTGSAVSDFTHYLTLNHLSSSFWTAFNNGGAASVRMALSDGTQIPCKVIASSDGGTTGTGLVVFKWSGSHGTSDTKKVRVYVGKSGASEPATTDTYGQFACFDSNVKAAYASGGGNDLTTNANNLTMTGSPTVGGASGPIDGSTATDFNGTTQYGLATASVPTAAPMTLIEQANTDNNTAEKGGMCVADTGQDSMFGLVWRGNQAGDPIAARCAQGGGGDRYANSATGYSTATWHQAVALFTSTTSRQGGINGALGTAETTSTSPGGIDTIGVGCFIATTPVILFDGRLSFASLSNTNRSADWIAYNKEVFDDPDQSDFYGTFTWTAAATPSTNKFFFLLGEIKRPRIFDQLTRFRRDARCDALYSLAP